MTVSIHSRWPMAAILNNASVNNFQMHKKFVSRYFFVAHTVLYHYAQLHAGVQKWNIFMITSCTSGWTCQQQCWSKRSTINVRFQISLFRAWRSEQNAPQCSLVPLSTNRPIYYIETKATGVKQSIASSLAGCATHWRNGEWSDRKLIVFGKACHMFLLCFRLKYYA